jgi:hypothetical protein
LKTAPAWVNILEMAEEWSTPPYEITGGGKLIWFIRWRVWRRERDKAWQRKMKSKS